MEEMKSNFRRRDSVPLESQFWETINFVKSRIFLA
jgi:hypothetical protein